MGMSGPPPHLNPGDPFLRFHCSGCGQLLSIPAHLAGTQGPCPTCGTWLFSPAMMVQPPAQAHTAAPAFQPDPQQSQHRRKRGHLLADTTVDYEHIGRLETLHTLKIIGLALLVLSFCLAVAWFMKDWISR